MVTGAYSKCCLIVQFMGHQTIVEQLKILQESDWAVYSAAKQSDFEDNAVPAVVTKTLCFL